jgi:hypothetical protein
MGDELEGEKYGWASTNNPHFFLHYNYHCY